jgi:iron complex transport system substrate-binding protein
MKKAILRVLMPLLAVLMLVTVTACDNADYTEYGGSITSLDAAGMEAARESYIESSILKNIEDSEETAYLPGGGIIKPEFEPLIKTAVDRNGETVDIPEKVDTIVSASPAISEILEGLGLSDRIIAADIYSADVLGIDPDVCTLDFFNLDIEQLVVLSPDLIIISGMSVWGDDDPYQLLRDMGTTVIYIPNSNTIESIKLDIEFIGAMTHTDYAAEELISDINTKIFEIREAVNGLPKPTVYFEAEAYPMLYSCGSDTLFNEMITIAGGENIYADESGWIQNSEESVLVRNPEFIISSAVYQNGEDISEISKRPGWGIISAVANHRVYSVDPDRTSRPSQYITDGIEEIARIIHPEAFL